MSTANLPPQAVMGQMINGFWLTFSIVAAAELGVADLLAEGPMPVADIAKKLGTNEDATFRLLRALAGSGIFAETDPRTFAQTPLSEVLRSDVPGSMRGLAQMSKRLHLKAWPELLHSVKTGETAFSHVFGAEIFDYVKKDQDAAAAFDAAMSGYTATTSKAVAVGYDFSGFSKVVDVGGGEGLLVAEIVGANAKASGVLFELPHVAGRAKAFLDKRGILSRCSVEGGDFFEAVPEGGDAYLLKMVLHDWDDERSIAILRNVRKAIKPDGRLLVMEAVLAEGNAPSPGKLLDVNMLVMTGGRERTEAEYRALYKKAGFDLVRVVPAHPSANVIEGKPV